MAAFCFCCLLNCLSSYCAVPGNILIPTTAMPWAGRWPGHRCCFCAAVLDRLELQCELESKGLCPVDEALREHDTPKCLWTWIIPRQSSPWKLRVEQRSSCSPWRTPCWSRWMPEGGCDPMGSLCWSRFLEGPVDPWREEPTLEQVCWQDL